MLTICLLIQQLYISFTYNDSFKMYKELFGDWQILDCWCRYRKLKVLTYLAQGTWERNYSSFEKSMSSSNKDKLTHKKRIRTVKLRILTSCLSITHLSS